MSWVTVIWSMIAGVSLALAVLHLLVWQRDRSAGLNLAFSLWSIAISVSAICELAMMHARSTAQYSAIVLWTRIPYAVLIFSFVWFVRQYLQTGRKWLVWLIYAVAVLELVVNFSVGSRNYFNGTDTLQRNVLWGEIVAVPSGMVIPWAWTAWAITALIFLFIVDAAVTAWRRQRSRRSLTIGVAFLSGNIGSGIFALATTSNGLSAPLSVALPSILIFLVIAFELSAHMLRTAQLAEALEENQQRMKLAAAAANLGLWEWDVVRDKIYTTEAIRERFGIGESAELNFQSYLQVLHPEDRERTEQAVIKVLESGSELEAEYRVIAGDGTTRWISARGRVQRAADGKPVLLRGISTDITARKEATEQLEFIKQSIDASPDSAFWIDVEGRIVYVNDAACTNLGYSRDELLRMRVFAVAPHLTPERWGAIWKMLRESKKYSGESVHRRKDGSEFPVEITSNYVVFSGQEYANGFARDITERKQVEEELRESMERYRAMVEGFDGLIYICSADYRIEYMNQRMIERTGRNAVGELCYRVLHEKDSVCEWCVNERVFKGETVHWEVQSPKDQRWYYVVNTPIRHGDGTISKQAMIQDITERKKAESDAGQLRQELAYLNRVMTMSELSSSLAHEINQPLGAILNYANAAYRFLSQNEPDLSKAREALQGIIRDDRRAADVILRIRGVLKKQEPQYQSVQINTVIREVLVFLRGEAIPAASIETVLAPELPAVRGDKIQLQQVLLNLLLNASDAMKGTSPDLRKIIVRTEGNAEKGVTVSVRDYGPGIDESERNKLFEPFYTTKPGGMGMGLAISARIIHDHGGTIRAENNADGGATFCFTVPAAAESVGRYGA